MTILFSCTELKNILIRAMDVSYRKVFTELCAMVRIRVRPLLFEKNRKEYKIRVKDGPVSFN